MNKKISLIMITVLLIISVIVNVCLLLSHTSSRAQIEDITTSALENDNMNIINKNPIDDFFNNHKLSDSSYFSIRRAEYLYMELWKAEMEHAYDELIKMGHIEIKNSINESRTKFIEFAENEAGVSMGVNVSDAFGDELGNYNETIHYGTNAQIVYNETLARFYKKRTIEIFEYFDHLGKKIDFVFTEKNISDDLLDIFQ